MTIFYKLAILATAALAAMAAPITTASDKVSTSSTGPFTGRGTWFTDTFGSCGKSFNTNDLIVAMNAEQMDGTAQCGRTVRITANGQTVDATVVDTCPSSSCSSGALDLSQAVFEQLAPLSQGVVQISWKFV
ncbi:RlpA-like double-psi beta-barrel-protein domain-containing protein-containing protein [Dissophora ornata]|nr:hypothetical protein BGZ58_001030 [Dissophora ornata]KAI8605090.1 RlpA-like double-psi beta-barrel-protein domain-containing protein-containing protein [Dissophora ornata]